MLRQILDWVSPPPQAERSAPAIATPPRRAIAPAAPIPARTVPVANIGRGFADPRQGGKTRIVVTVDQALFEELRERALARQIPVAAIIRELLDAGLREGER